MKQNEEIKIGNSEKRMKNQKARKKKTTKKEKKYGLNKLRYVLTVIRSRLLVPDMHTKKLEDIFVVLMIKVASASLLVDLSSLHFTRNATSKRKMEQPPKKIPKQQQ